LRLTNAGADDADRIVHGERAIGFAPAQFIRHRRGTSQAGLRSVVDDPHGRRGTAAGQRRKQPEAAEVVRVIRQPHDGPLPAGPTLAPQNLGRADGPADQRRRVAVLHVREFVAVVLDHDVGRANAGHPRAADLAVAQRVEQDRETREVMRVLRSHADQRDLVLELAQMVVRGNNRRVDSQHMEPQAVLAAAVADLDDVALAKLVERLGELVVLLALPLADRVEKRVPDFRRNLQRLAGLGLLVTVPHRLRPDPQP
jgi:hypothetical protein